MGVLVICILYCTLTEVSLNLTEVSLTLTEVFSYLFLIREANARVKLVKTGHGPHFSTLVVICVVWLLFVLFCVLFVCKCVLPPGDNPIAVNRYINIAPKHSPSTDRKQWVAITTLRLPYHRESPSARFIRGWVSLGVRLDSTGSDPRTVQPVARCYTD